MAHEKGTAAPACRFDRIRIDTARASSGTPHFLSVRQFVPARRNSLGVAPKYRCFSFLLSVLRVSAVSSTSIRFRPTSLRSRLGLFGREKFGEEARAEGGWG